MQYRSIICLSNQITFIPLTSIYFFLIDFSGQKSTDGQTLTLIVCLGFFLFETGWYVAHPGSKTWTLWVHHIGALFYLSTPLFYGHSGAECCGGVFVTENTIPALMLRWFMRDAGCRPLYVIIVDYIFLTTYFYYRAIVGTALTYTLAVHPDAYTLVKVFTFWVWLVGLVYFKTTAASSIRYTKKVLNGSLKEHEKLSTQNFSTGCRNISQS